MVAGLVTGVVGPSRVVEGSAWRVVVVDRRPSSPDDFPEIDDDAVTEVTNTYGTEYRVAVEDGRWFDLTVSVANDGAVPVRLTDVTTRLATDLPVRVLDDVEVTVPVDELSPSDAWRPLGDGLVVPPGASWRVRLVGRLDAGCTGVPRYADGGWIATDELVDVRYEVLGVPRHAAPPVPWMLRLDGPFGGGTEDC